jgi:hypothetical protein
VAVLTGKCMNEMDIDTESMTHMSKLPDILSNPFTYIIPDVSEGEISIDRKDNNDINLVDEFIVIDGVLIPRPNMMINHLNEFHESTQSLHVVEYTKADTIESL